MNRCLGCGALLQSDDETLAGYIPEKEKDKNLCMRCFRLVHYNEFKMVDVLSNEQILNEINKKAQFVFFLVDLLNINTEVLNEYHKITTPKSLIISKCDYIPKDLKKDKIKNWLKTEYKVSQNISFLSSKKNYNIRDIVKEMNIQKVNEAYLCGYTNSGKSTLVNTLKENNQITTSVLPNTTMDFILIKLDENLNLIDSPGFQYKSKIYDLTEEKFIKKMVPKTYLKPITYQLKKGTSILINEKVRIEVCLDTNLTIYMSNLLDIVKLYEKNDTLKNLNSQTWEIWENQDLVIKSLGFINFKKNTKVKVYIQDKSLIEVRNALF